MKLFFALSLSIIVHCVVGFAADNYDEAIEDPEVVDFYENESGIRKFTGPGDYWIPRISGENKFIERHGNYQLTFIKNCNDEWHQRIPKTYVQIISKSELEEAIIPTLYQLAMDAIIKNKLKYKQDYIGAIAQYNFISNWFLKNTVGWVYDLKPPSVVISPDVIRELDEYEGNNAYFTYYCTYNIPNRNNENVKYIFKHVVPLTKNIKADSDRVRAILQYKLRKNIPIYLKSKNGQKKSGK